MKIGRGLKILVMVFVVLLAGAAFPMYKKSLPTLPWSKGDIDSKLIGDINIEGISSISLKQGESEVKLARNGEVWTVNGNKVEQDKIDGFLEKLNEGVWGDITSNNPENHVEMGVDDTNGILVTVKETDKETAFIIGKSGRTFGTFYVKHPGEDNVYLAKGELNNVTNASELSWRDRTVVNLSSGSVGKVEIYGAKYLTIAEGEVENVFSPFEALGFLNEEERREFDASWGKSTVEIFETGDGEKVLAKLEVLPKENEYWIKVLMDSAKINVEAKIGINEPTDIYKVSTGVFDQIFLAP